MVEFIFIMSGQLTYVTHINDTNWRAHNEMFSVRDFDKGDVIFYIPLHISDCDDLRSVALGAGITMPAGVIISGGVIQISNWDTSGVHSNLLNGNNYVILDDHCNSIMTDTITTIINFLRMKRIKVTHANIIKKLCVLYGPDISNRLKTVQLRPYLNKSMTPIGKPIVSAS